MDRAGFWPRELHLTYPKLWYKEIRVTAKIKVLSSGTLPQILDLENFATARRWCGSHNSTTVELVVYTYDSRTLRGWMHKVYYTLVDCNRCNTNTGILDILLRLWSLTNYSICTRIGMSDGIKELAVNKYLSPFKSTAYDFSILLTAITYNSLFFSASTAAAVPEHLFHHWRVQTPNPAHIK